MAVGTYQVLKKVFPKWLVFLTQMIAIGLCWTPTTVLYHYLTYFFFQFAVLCLFQGITGDQKKRTGYFLAAGVLLGVNLAVRMPNVTHMLLIVAVWYGCDTHVKDKKKFQSLPEAYGNMCIGICSRCNPSSCGNLYTVRY